ncbi:helix-turn-helix transcriptional regulator [Limosilactobacillus fermentum]
MKLADKIRQLRIEKGWSQERLAEEMHVSRQAASKWESEGAEPELSKLRKLADLFGVTTDYLLRDENDERVTPEQPLGPSKEEVVSYLTAVDRVRWELALGVGLFELSIAPQVYLSANPLGMSATVAQGLGMTILMVGIALAIILCWHSGTVYKRYPNLRTQPVSGPAREYVQSDLAKQQRKTWLAVVGIVVICLSWLPIQLFGDSAALQALLLVLVGLGLAVFLWAETAIQDRRRLLRGQREPSKLDRYRNVFWMATGALFIVLATFDATENYSWLVFIVAAPVWMLMSGKGQKKA